MAQVTVAGVLTVIEDVVLFNIHIEVMLFTNDHPVMMSAGRHFKRHKMMARMALWLKTLLLGVVLPGAVAVALFAAWKGITLSLMALLLAGIIGIKGLVASGKDLKLKNGGNCILLNVTFCSTFLLIRV